MTAAEQTTEISGKISAHPNPIGFGQGCVVISWETTDPAGAEIRVSTGAGDERLVNRGKRAGQIEISWIVDSTVYDFRLYAVSDAVSQLDSVKVKRDFESVPLMLREVAEEALRGNIDMAELSRFIAALIPAYLQADRFSHVFPVLLQQFTSEAMHGKIGADEGSQFIGKIVPKYLDGSISGKIIATPNPVSFADECFRISWGTNDPAGGEVRILTPSGDEKLLTREPAGSMEIPWLGDSTTYDFRLYAASHPDTPLDSLEVSRDPESASGALRQIADEVNRGNIDMADLSDFIEAVVPRCLEAGKFPELFRSWERHGFHVTPVHFYQPIPDTQTLSESVWKIPSQLAGVEMNDSIQLELLRKHFPKFRNEYEQFPSAPSGKGNGFYLNNQLFDGADALVAYCMVRHFQPRLIIEVGSGFSSLVLGQAAEKNKNSDLICIEPFPRDFLREGFPGLRSLIEKKVQEIDLKFFSQLESGDILFIDSSHTVKIGGDVNYLFLEVLPRLKPGVLVHVHDIFLPFDYRRDWVLDQFRFWTEQYLLQAFLMFNSEFEVIMANSYLNHYHQEDLKAAFPDLPSWGGGSFWMRRKTAAR